MLNPQMSPEHCFETREDYSKMVTVGEATVSSSHSTDSTNHVHTEGQLESWERSPVTPPPSGAAQRTGRWTPDEKILFLYGLKRFGKGRWKKMSIYLPHRSLVQIKSHAQKVLKRLELGEHVFRRLEENYNIIDNLIAQAAQQHEALSRFSDKGGMSIPGRRPGKNKFFEEPALSYSQLFGTTEPNPQAGKSGREQAPEGDVAALAASALCQLSSLPK